MRKLGLLFTLTVFVYSHCSLFEDFEEDSYKEAYTIIPEEDYELTGDPTLPPLLDEKDPEDDHVNGSRRKRQADYGDGTCDNCGCFKWTPWMDGDNPTERGDWETLNFPNEMGYPGTLHVSTKQVCAMPISVECRADGGKLSWTETYDNLYVPCTRRLGIVCRNEDQENRRCLDYSVRFLCWRECSYFQWSDWYDYDDPDDNDKIDGDYEILGDTIPYNRWPCPQGSTPVDVECATLSGAPIHRSNRRGIQCDLQGLSCNDKKQGGTCDCEDYKVRFLCPVGFIPADYTYPRVY